MMLQKKALLPMIAGVILLIALGLSVLFFIRGNKRWHSYVLFFPKYTDHEQIEGEIRKIRKHDDPETDIDRVVDEIMLGPSDVRYYPVIPAEGEINTLILEGDELFIDFSHSILFSEESSPLTLSEGFNLLSRSLFWNFPKLNTIHYSINGEVPVDIMASIAETRGEVKKK